MMTMDLSMFGLVSFSVIMCLRWVENIANRKRRDGGNAQSGNAFAELLRILAPVAMHLGGL